MAIKILIVDDEADIRDVLKLTLSEENYEVLEAKDGEEALKIINSNPPDLQHRGAAITIADQGVPEFMMYSPLTGGD